MKKFTETELKSVAPLTLGMVGDAVHTLYARTKFFYEYPYKNNELHAMTSKEVCAKSQALMAKKVVPFLTESELFIFKKGKNAKVNSVPKNAELIEYKLATGFETLLGYLYLLGEYDRIEVLFRLINEDKDSEN